MRKRLARILCGLLTISMLGGCGTVDEVSLLPVSEQIVASSEEEPEEEVFFETLNPAPGSETSFATSGNKKVNTPSETDINPTLSSGAKAGDLLFTNAPYVLVYNPKIYDGYSDSTMASGDYSSMILHNVQKVEGMEDKEEPVKLKEQPLQFTSDEMLTPYILEDVQFDGKKADVLEPIYQKGDTHDFFYNTGEYRTKGTFKCVYAGEHCYIWSIDKSITEKSAKAQGKVFDEKIYPTTLEMYGQPRFTENGGKVNILYYSLKEQNYGGFFSWADIYSSTELTPERAESKQYNTDHAIINICSHCGKDYNLSTLAHELQHQVVASDWFFYKKTPHMQSWLNETMSANAEENYQNGIKDSYGSAQKFYNSEAYRKGQSLYNFKTDYANDTGTYGVVYLFEEYLKKLAGENIFSRIHSFWRTSMSRATTEAESIMKSVPEDVRTAVDETYYYDEQLKKLFTSDSDIWMSKMTLDFYINVISNSGARTDIYAKSYTYNSKKIKAVQWMNVFRKEKLYLGNGNVPIEGGGCLFVATQDGNFYKPASSDDNLIFVAFDNDFQPIATNLKDPNEFYWNRSRKLVMITDPWEAENNAQQVMYKGISDALSEGGFVKGESVESNNSDGKLKLLRNYLTLKDGRPGAIIMTYDPTDKNVEEYKELLTEAHQKGILVITCGPHSLEEEDVTWGVHFDHSNLITSISDFYTFRAGDGIHNLGKSIGAFALQIVTGEEKHWNLIYNVN